MDGRLVAKWVIGLCGCFLLTVMVISGCRQFNGIGNTITGSPATSIPDRVVVWADPLDAASTGITIRDANNDAGRFLVVGIDGSVEFFPAETVCNDCTADIPNAVIDIDGNQIDIRFGVGVTGEDTERRPFLVDNANGTFVELVGGGNVDVSFQPTDTPFEDPNDDSDDRAVESGSEANPSVSQAKPSTTSSLPSLCGATGALPIWAMLLSPALFWRRR